MTEQFDLKYPDIGRWVQRISTGEVSKVRQDSVNGHIHIGICYEWERFRDDFHFVKIVPEAEHDSNHCKDCCCAKVWKSLDIKEYTGKHIAEHVEELKDSHVYMLYTLRTLRTRMNYDKSDIAVRTIIQNAIDKGEEV